MKKLNWVLAFILGYVTCGIFQIFFWYEVDGDVRKLNKNPTKAPMNYWLAVVLGFVTCGIVPLVYYYQVFGTLEEEAKRMGITKFYSPFVSLLIMFVPVYSFYYVCDYVNTLAGAKGILTEN